jgi:hypothetical protein
MKAILFRTRVAALWLAVAIATSASLLLYVFVPGAVEELLAGEMEGETLTDAWGFFFTALAIVPLVMAGMALLVGDRVNHYVNLIAGLVVGLFGVFAMVGHMVEGDFNGHILMIGLAGGGAFLIAGLALAELRHATQEPAVPASERSGHRETTTV